MSRDTLRLLPAPRELERTGPAVRVDPSRPALRQAADLPGQGYRLEIAADGVSIEHADAAGLRYARATLAEIARQSGAELPALRIRDWPDFPVRGYMLDVSRDRVPTRETLACIVGWLERLRLNHLQLYTEHSFAYRDHERVWRDASPITPDDVRWLDGLCRERGIELCANQQSFGHMGRWLAHEPYRALAEAPDGWQTASGVRMSPGVLYPDDASLELVLGLWRELLPCFSSRRVNIGCDETTELGRGRSRAAVERSGSARVYLDFVRKLIDALHAGGCEVQFWGDILRSQAELVTELPAEGVIALAWHYEAPVALGDVAPALLERFAEFGVTQETLAGFAGQVEAFAESGLPFWVCPGTSSWNSLVGRLPNARANLEDAARVGLERGARGYLITDWGDNGHLQPPSVSVAPLALGAAMSWCLERNRALALAPLLDELLFEDGAGELGAALETIGACYAGTGLGAANASPLHTALVAGRGLPTWGRAREAGIRDVVGRLDDAERAIGRAAPACRDGEIVRRELIQAIRLARHGAWRIARSADFQCPDSSALRDGLRDAIEEQRACWLLRSRPGGLSDSVERLEAALDGS